MFFCFTKTVAFTSNVNLSFSIAIICVTFLCLQDVNFERLICKRVSEEVFDKSSAFSVSELFVLKDEFSFTFLLSVEKFNIYGT